MRPRLGALSKSVFSGYLLIKKALSTTWFPKKSKPNQNKQTKRKKTKALLDVFPSLGSRAHIETNFEVIFWQPSSSVGRSVAVGHGSVCGGLRCVWESTPKQGFSPLLSATTRMYHHVTVQWIVLRLLCEHPDLTSHHIISHPSPPVSARRLGHHINAAEYFYFVTSAIFWLHGRLSITTPRLYSNFDSGMWTFYARWRFLNMWAAFWFMYRH